MANILWNSRRSFTSDFCKRIPLNDLSLDLLLFRLLEIGNYLSNPRIIIIFIKGKKEAIKLMVILPLHLFYINIYLLGIIIIYT